MKLTGVQGEIGGWPPISTYIITTPNHLDQMIEHISQFSNWSHMCSKSIQ